MSEVNQKGKGENEFLRILIIDDDPDDRALIIRELRKEFFNLKVQEIFDEKKLEEALKEKNFDLVITDYNLVWITGLDILNKVKSKYPDCPVIMVTGTGNEEIAVEAMKAGLDDYVLKSVSHLKRLPLAIHLVLAKYENLVKKRQAESHLKESEEQYRTLVENLPIGVYRNTPGPQGKFIEANIAMVKIYGNESKEEIFKINVSDLYQNPEDRKKFSEKLIKNGVVKNEEIKLRKKDGTLIVCSITAHSVYGKDGSVEYFDGVIEDVTKSKELEIALDKIRRQQEAILNNIPDIAWLKDRESKYIAANEPFGNACGVSPKDLVGKTDFDIWTRELAEKYRADDREIIQGGERKRFEEPLIDKDGVMTWVETIKTPIFDEKGNIIGTTGIAHDISHRKKMEEEIQRNYQSQFALSAILQLSHKNISLDTFLNRSLDILISIPWLAFQKRGAIFLVDEESGLLVMNSQNGLSEPIQKGCKQIPFGKCICGQAALTQKVQFVNCLDEKHTVRYDGIIPHGHYCVPILSAGKTLGVINLYLKEGHPFSKKEEDFLVAVANTLSLIIEHWKAEKEISALAKFPSENPQPVFRVERSGKIIFANESSKPIMDFWGCKIGTLLPEDLRNLIYEVMESNVKKRIEIMFDSQIYSFLFVPVVEVGYVNIYGNDIAELKHIEAELEKQKDNLEETVQERTKELKDSLKQLEEANLHKNRFLSTMSHELRTPLNAIIGFTDLLAGQFYGLLNEKQISYIKQVDSSSKHLLSLINDLLDIAKIDAGRVELNLEQFVLEDGINAITAMVKTQLNKKNVQLEIECQKDGGIITADNRKFKQILLNLLTNAIKYTPAEGNIKIRALRQLSNIYVSVADTGIGISPEDCEKIFSEFYQVDRVRDESLGGVGIGLALTKRLVRLHGGEIGVESEHGKGSVFWFTIPQPDIVHKKETKQVVEQKLESRKTGYRILVAEDNEDNLSLILEMLSIQSHKVFIAKNGQEALDIALSVRPDLILMDMRMPRMDGYEAIPKLRKMPEFQNTPVIALTASAGKDVKDKCLSVGCNDYLLKPIKSKELFEMLDKYLK